MEQQSTSSSAEVSTTASTTPVGQKSAATKRKSPAVPSESAKRTTKITDFWKTSPNASNGVHEDATKSSKSPCSDRTNHNINGTSDVIKAVDEPNGVKMEDCREPKKPDQMDDDDDVVLVSEESSSKKSPRKSQRNTPVKSYREVDKDQFEEKKTKQKNRSLEKFREFFKNAAERSVSKKDELVFTITGGNKLNKGPKRTRESFPPETNGTKAFKKRITDPTGQKRRGRPPRSEEERAAKKEEYRKKISEKLKEKRKLDREAKEREKLLHDDLCVEGLQALPEFDDVVCGIPREGFGDFLCILEFLSTFSSELSVKDYFSQGITFDILERAFTEQDTLGVLVNVVQILLSCIFKLQQQEWVVIDYNTLHDGDDLYGELAEAQNRAAFYGREFRNTYGFMFHTIPVDSFTYSDVLRYHLKASGAPGIDMRDRVHCHQGFSPKEDPGLLFVIDHPDIMEKLDQSSIADLDILEKIKIIRCLVDQLLTFDLFRDTIEDGLEKCVDLKIQLKKLLWRKKIIEDEEKGIKREVEETAEDEKKRRNWRYALPEIPLPEVEKKLVETEDALNKVWYRFGLSSLGEDRAHRIYNVMHSIPAIIVETLNSTQSVCVEGGTPGFSEESEMLCSGSEETCPIHKEQQYSYCFISNQEQLDALIEALTVKGNRENTLKETLINELDYLKTVIKKTPVSKLDNTKTDVSKRKYQSESIKPSNVAGLVPCVALDLTFRELLLDMEEKSVQGSLGGFKDPEARNSWRLELEKPLLEMQNLEPEDTNKMFEEQMRTEKEIRDMASKLIEFADTIPVKFLKAPLGDQGPSLRNKLENWRSTLPNCQNFSQLFLYYLSLETSIEWQKGLTNARCKVCRGKATPDRMVRCEQCDLVFHLSCVKPALREVPAKEWFCKSCEPDTMPESPRKKSLVRVDAEDPEEEFVSNDYCEVCLQDEKLINCDVCPRSFHLDCIQLKRAPRGDWSCLACTLGPKKYKAELKELKKVIEEREAFEDSLLDTTDINQCLKCGELLSRGHIVCVGCGRKYHLACADLSKRPKGDWYCKKRCEPGYVPISRTEEEESDEEEDEEQQEDVKKEVTMDADVYGFDYKACCDILDVLKKSDHAWPFVTPVSKKDAPDYFKFIKKPMDFSLIQTKLNDMKYPSNETFVEDVLQVFINCETYNLEEAVVYKEGRRLLDIFIGLIDNYSMTALLDPSKFCWLEEAMRSRCSKCHMEFASGIKKVCCRFCTTTLHLKCAGLRITIDKWTCEKCIDKHPDESPDQTNGETNGNQELDKESFDFKECSDLVEFLIKDNQSFPFRKPVSKKEAPDYFDIIENPMDLSTIQSSLNNMGYKTNKDVVEDVLLMFRNCEQYNDEKSDIYHGAARFWNVALKKINECGLGSSIDQTKVPKWKPSRVSSNRRSLF